MTLTSYQSVQAGANKFTSKSVRVGDNLISILRQQGFSLPQREQVVSAHKGLKNLFLTLDTKYLIQRSGQDVEIRIFDSQTSDAFRIIKNKNGVRAFKYDPQYKISIVQVDGKVYGSILGSIHSKIKSNWVATRFMDAYAFETKTGRKLRAGAPYSFTVEKLFEEGHFIKYGEILRTSLVIGSEQIQKKFVRGNGGGVFIQQSDLLEDKPFYAPVNYIRIASHFQPHRRHPITKKLQAHLGVDFEAPVGEPIYAPRTGVVARFGHNRAAGNYIVLLHSNGVETAYNHMHKIDRRIRTGLKIRVGEKLGEIGCTGYCTRAHLHFAVKKKGHMVDPLKYIKAYPHNMEAMLEKRIAAN